MVELSVLHAHLNSILVQITLHSHDDEVEKEPVFSEVKPVIGNLPYELREHFLLTLILLEANLANTKSYKKP